MTGLVIKCCVIALITGIVIMILKEIRLEWSGLCGLLAGVMILIVSFSMVDQIITSLSSVVSISGLDKTHFQAIVKCMGITLLVDFISGFCKGQGQLSIAVAVETVGRLGICLITIPFALDLLEMATQMLST